MMWAFLVSSFGQATFISQYLFPPSRPGYHRNAGGNPVIQVSLPVGVAGELAVLLPTACCRKNKNSSNMGLVGQGTVIAI